MPLTPATHPSSPSAVAASSPQSNHSADASASLAPPQSPYPQYIEPSPVDSQGTASTDATDIDDVAQDKHGREEDHTDPRTPDSGQYPLKLESPQALARIETKIETNLDSRAREDPESGTHSVIHVPEQFKAFHTSQASSARDTTSPTQDSEHTAVSSQSPGFKTPIEKRRSLNLDQKSPAASTINTNVSIRPALDKDTPRAQTRQEAEEEWRRRNKRAKSMDSGNLRQSSGTPGLWSTWLADIPEGLDGQKHAGSDIAGDDDSFSPAQVGPREASITDKPPAQITALKTALSECWTLCNTLATLSSTHRKHVFHSHASHTDLQETAWQSCWRLCQSLYHSRDEDHTDHVLSSLEMCREFCQALFDARRRDDEVADSILRVSFELNNHLYNTHDRNLPIAFQERTLDFYLTLCHRLMKQRTSLPEETDALLRACWGLAEMLFSMRQNNRDGKPPDEDLLSSSVQACWELCDLFREGWSQVRPERGTPKPSQTTFSSSYRSTPQSNRSSPSIARSAASFHEATSGHFPPETPTTIIEDTNDESMDDDQSVPNILVLGPDKSSGSSSGNHQRWSSSASNLSTYSEARSNVTSNTATSSSAAAQTCLNHIRLLIMRATNIAGFTSRGYSPPKSSSAPPSAMRQNAALLSFVKAMPRDAFGSQPWQTALVPKLKKLVVAWPDLVRHVGSGGDLGDGSLVQSTTASRHATGVEVARAVGWMVRSEQHAWLRDLFRVVFGVWPEDTANLGGVSVQG